MEKIYKSESANEFPKEIYLDKQKDIKVIIGVGKDNKFTYTISVSNIKSDNLFNNIARITKLEVHQD